MADRLTVGELVYKISGDMENLKTELAKAETEITNMKSAMEKNTAASDKMNKAFSTVGKAVKGFIAAFAVKEVINFGKAAVQTAQDLLEQQTKLAQVLRVSQNATDDQIKSMFDYAEALDQVGVIDKQAILAAEAQLATYDLSTESIRTLTPALLDYLAAEKGSNATKEDAIAITNGLAQAIQGNYSSLSRTGFILDDETKKLIENGTQAERVQAITDVLNSTYKDYNKTLLDQNPQIKFSKAIGNIKEQLGLALLPAINAVEAGLLEMAGGFGESGIDVEQWGKAFYRVAQAIIAIAKIFKEAFLGIQIAWNGLQNIFIGGAIAIVKGLQIAAKAVGKNTETFDIALQDLKDSFKQNLDDISGATDESTKNMDSLMNNLQEIWGAEGFQQVAAKAGKAFEEGKQAVDSFAGASEDAAKETATLQDKLLGVLDTLHKTTDSLNGDVAKAFQKFNDTVKDTLDETDDALAQSVLDAQDKIKDLNKQILEEEQSLQDQIAKLNRNPDSSTGQDIADAQKDSAAKVQNLKDQIAQEQKVLDSRVGYEDRQAKLIEEIRQKLTDAGIDADQEGLTSLLNVQSLEEKIADERALRDMDEFSREEELQRRKLLAITDNLIAEVTATREKIEQQKSLEGDLTTFLIDQNAIRKEDVDAFADAAIAKYGEMANALKSAISLQQQLNALRTSGATTTKPQFASGGLVGAQGGEVHPGEYVIPANMVSSLAGLVSQLEGVRKSGGSITNNRNISAPVTINAPGASTPIDFRAVSREMGFEISRM